MQYFRIYSYIDIPLGTCHYSENLYHLLMVEVFTPNLISQVLIQLEPFSNSFS